jgi:hypothetical protein
VAGDDGEERDAFDGALGVGDLSVGRERETMEAKSADYRNAESWFHLATSCW